ncbi:BamA/TamA family outer membrane protein [Shewanella sp. UCD-KL12]|uniref:BamA/TamA family outer membrane protein n=1 Tax=Shewanella sp. UCD-KL12 TaxID=1917163 RepID=UPI00274090EF|nr:BamA/TamA family outer membrane protein [Shewanella sp. UCD-KL12]
MKYIQVPILIIVIACCSMMSGAIAHEHSSSLPTKHSLLPFFETVEQAELRSYTYDKAIDEASEAQDDCSSEPECDQLSLYETDLEYAKSAHIDKNGLDMFDILGGPAYSPEGGIMAAVGGLYSFKTDRNQAELQRSSVSLFGVGSKTDGGLGYGIRSKQNLFFDNNAIRYTGHFLLANQSENFWGVGQVAGEQREPSDDTLLDKMSLTYNANLDFQNTYGFYIGPAIRIKYFDPDQSTLPPSAIEDENFQAFKDKPLSIGLGFSLNYDSRDVTVNAWEGQYLNFEYINYNPAFGSDNQYEKVLLDHRYYLSLNPGRVFAFYNAFQWSTGDVPYYDMPTLGGQSSLRGIYQGRYRDNSTIEHTLEYRHTFLRGNGDLSAHGMTLWAGIGAIAGTDTDLYQALLYSYGIGYRYELQPRMNVRLDLGLSEDGNGFYLTFTEAF